MPWGANIVRLAIAASVVLAMDQLAKALAATHFADGRSVSLCAWTRITCVRNPGRGPNLPVLLIGWGSVLGCALLFIQQSAAFQSDAAQLALGAALGGSASNVWDRLRRGAVIDFLAIGPWPIFNLADAAIVLGVAIALWHHS